MPQESSDDNDNDTRGSSRRHWLTNDLLAIWLILAFTAYLFLPYLGFETASKPNAAVLTAFITGFGIAVAWAFGRDAVEAWRGKQGD